MSEEPLQTLMDREIEEGDLAGLEESSGSRKATMRRELMAPRTDRTTRIPSGVASHAATQSVFVNLRDASNFKNWHGPGRPRGQQWSSPAGCLPPANVCVLATANSKRCVLVCVLASTGNGKTCVLYWQ